MEIIVRRARLKDVNDILPLWEEMMRFHAALDPRLEVGPRGVDYMRQVIPDWLRSEACCVLVAEVEGHIVGYIAGRVADNPPIFRLRAYGHVSDICVAPEWRRQGIGRRLYEALREWFKDQGLSVIQLNVAHRNPASQAFWRAMGFEDYLDYMWSKVR
ncbi:MAG: GNAT family N-acetyltransferase [Anaerolineae bacterium]